MVISEIMRNFANKFASEYNIGSATIRIFLTSNRQTLIKNNNEESIENRATEYLGTGGFSWSVNVDGIWSTG